MSQRDNFAGGFLLGTIVGSVVGGVLGTVLANRSNRSLDTSATDAVIAEGSDSEENIESARRRLEDKIAQLNLVIDDVRHQLGNVNGIREAQEEEG